MIQPGWYSPSNQHSHKIKLWIHTYIFRWRKGSMKGKVPTAHERCVWWSWISSLYILLRYSFQIKGGFFPPSLLISIFQRASFNGLNDYLGPSVEGGWKLRTVFTSKRWQGTDSGSEGGERPYVKWPACRSKVRGHRWLPRFSAKGFG